MRGGEVVAKIFLIFTTHPNAGSTKTQCQRTSDLPMCLESGTLLLMDSSIPSWLEETPITSTHNSEYIPVANYPRTAGEIAHREWTYENFFERALDRFALGHQLSDIVSDDPRNIDQVQFMRWIRKDKSRKERYLEALEISAEILLPTLITTAHGRDSMNDVKRDSLIVDTTIKYMAMANPKRFGKEASMATGNSGGGGIIINIGQVESPYVVDHRDTVGSDTVDTVTDVEVKE